MGVDLEVLPGHRDRETVEAELEGLLMEFAAFLPVDEPLYQPVVGLAAALDLRLSRAALRAFVPVSLGPLLLP